MNIKKDITWRIGLAYLCTILFGAAILWKIFYIQNIQGNYYRSLSDSLIFRYAETPGERGNIYSNDGQLLATSLPRFEIRMDMRAEGLTNGLFKKSIDSLSLCLNQLLHDQPSSEYKKELTAAYHRGERYYLIAKNLSYTQLDTLKNFPLVRLGQNKGGLIIVEQSKRIYPLKELANRTVGYVRDATVKPVGLEAAFNNDLSGTPGKRLMEKISGGNYIPVNDNDEVDPKNGYDIITTLDVNMQDVAEQALQHALIENNADHGCAVVMDVQTGAIRAMANLGKTNDGSYAETFNYAVGENNEPGSTFKLASLISLLDDHKISIQDTVDLEDGIYNYWNQTMRDAEHHNLRRVSVESAFAHSSNVGISKLVYSHYNKDPQQYLNHLHALGLDQKLNIEIPGEAMPVVKTMHDPTWTQYTLPWMSVGYEVRETPLQMLALYNAVANHGAEMKPYLVHELDQYGKVVKTFQPQIINQKICSEKTLSDLQTCLLAVVDSGTARNIFTTSYQIAGKTGTALVAAQNHGYADHVYQSSFIGYFPADHPKYSIAVVINNPTKGNYYGALVAAPVFRAIADYAFANDYSVHPILVDQQPSAPFQTKTTVLDNDLRTISHQMNLPAANPQAGQSFQYLMTSSSMKSTQDPSNDEVPDVTGMGLRDALYILENAGLKVHTIGYGFVASQSIVAGSPLVKDQTIVLTMNE